MKFSYNFPAVRGIQANDEYFICMVPLRLLNKLFSDEYNEVEPEFRAQRKLNESRIPEIKDYILKNRDTYIFSALCASFDGKYKFTSIDGSDDAGVLSVSMDSTFLINDGQHRRAAILEAIREDETLLDETISIVMFKDKGLSRSQQMFTDLNKHAVNTTKSLNALYDSNDPISVLTKKIIKNNVFLNKYTDKEKDNLGKFSSNLFTLNNFVNCNAIILKGFPITESIEIYIDNFWQNIVKNISEFNELEAHTITKKDLRSSFIITQGVAISAFGMLGHYFLENKINDLSILNGLKDIDWKRNNPIWMGRAINKKGTIIKNRTSVYLTYLVIKDLLKIKLTDTEYRDMKSKKI